MTVRGLWPVVGPTTFSSNFQEVSSLSEIARVCKERDCEDVFRDGMKLGN